AQPSPEIETPRRSVTRYLFAASLLLLMAFLVGMPGVFLLNQQYGWIPLPTEVYDIEMSGHSVSIGSVMRVLIGMGVILGTSVPFLLAIGIRNWLRNRRLVRTDS
ncbi:MAG: hypothetical protein AAF802_29370, partial [Planctomycetota bacterium]